MNRSPTDPIKVTKLRVDKIIISSHESLALYGIVLQPQTSHTAHLTFLHVQLYRLRDFGTSTRSLRSSVVIRGRATERQDRHIPLVQSVAEGSEELRLVLCQLVGRIVSQLTSRGTIGVIRPYLDDAVLFLVTQFRDPFPPVKMEALRIISTLVLQPSLEQVRRSRVSLGAAILYLSFLWRTLRPQCTRRKIGRE